MASSSSVSIGAFLCACLPSATRINAPTAIDTTATTATLTTATPAPAAAAAPAAIPCDCQHGNTKNVITNITTQAAQQMVLSSPELRGAIFLKLRAADLVLNCQAVCKGWREEILATPEVQARLFFKAPVKERPVLLVTPSTSRAHMTAQFGVAPVFGLSASTQLEHPASFWTDEDNDDINTNKRVRVYKNPMLDKIFIPVVGDQFNATKYYVDLTMWNDRNESWRKMLVASPPAQSLTLHVRFLGTSNDIFLIVSRNDGVTIEDLVGALRNASTARQAFVRVKGMSLWV